MFEEIPYQEGLDAFHKWNKVKHTRLDISGFFKFIGHDTFGKTFQSCHLPSHAVRRIRQINSAYGHAIIKAYLINESSVEAS